MMKKQSVINFVLSAIVAFLLVDRFRSNPEEYPLENEVQAIKEEFYLYYLAQGKYPQERGFLSKRSKNIIAAYPDRFRWDDENVFLHFTAQVPGDWAPNTIGEQSDIFEHNCRVYEVHANWSEGFRDDYQATEADLEAAGATRDRE